MTQSNLAALLSHHGGISNKDSAMVLASIIQSGEGLGGAMSEKTIDALKKIGEEQREAAQNLAPLNNNTFTTMMNSIKEVAQNFTRAVLDSLLMIGKLVHLGITWLVTDTKTADIKAVFSNELDRTFASYARLGAAVQQLGGASSNAVSVGYEVAPGPGARFQIQKLRTEEALNSLGALRDSVTPDEAKEFASRLGKSGLVTNLDEEAVAKGLTTAGPEQLKHLVSAYEAGLEKGVKEIQRAFNEKSSATGITVKIDVPGTTRRVTQSVVPSHPRDLVKY
jgi:hypothetical protein